MKNIFKYFSTAASILAIGSLAVTSCEETDYVSPDTRFTPFNFSAQFKFVNASPDAPTMDFFVQGIEAGNDLTFGNAQTGYTRIPLASNLTTFGQVSLRATASSGNIGGTLGSAAAIFRAGNTNNNAFAPINRGRYTVFAVDTINRPRPERTLNVRFVEDENNELISIIYPDVTYYSSRTSFTAAKLAPPAGDTTITLTGNNSLDVFNLVRKYNGNVNPSFMTSIGAVPLGSTDVGGTRFYVWQDSLRTFAIGNVTQSAIRFAHLVPNAPAVWARLRPSAGGSNLAIATNVQYALSVGGGFSPSVGSRVATTTSVNFPAFTTVAAGTPIDYILEIATDVNFNNIVITVNNLTFLANKNYTIYASGVVGKPSLTAKVIQHD